MSVSTLARLDAVSRERLRHSAREAQKLETQWDAKVRSMLLEHVDKIVRELDKTGRAPQLDFEEFFVRHYFDAARTGLKVAETEEELEKRIRLAAKPPKVRVPDSLRKLRELYDQWRKGRYTPKRPKEVAERIQKAYLEKVQSVWQQYSEDFRNGTDATQREVVTKIREAAEVVVSRAQTIVRTETTNYYNHSRREYYDESEDVTHYLFIAVRDKATTKWCSEKTIGGLRGRSGLVYAKGDPLLIAEQPACHWNCRSELLPLNPDNPSHLRLIQDKRIQRRLVKCHPLPPEWRRAA